MKCFPVRNGACSSDKYFQAFTHLSPSAVLLITCEGFIRNLNPTSCSFFEIDREKAVGKHLTEILPACSHDEIFQLLQTFRDGGKKPVLLDLTTPSGKVKSLSVEMFPCQENCGDMQCMIAIFSNVTYLQKSEEALRRVLADRLKTSSAVFVNSDLKYQSIVEASPNWISLVDAEGRVLVTNLAGRQILAREESSINGSCIWEFFPGNDAEMLKEGFNKGIDNNEIWQKELSLFVKEAQIHLAVICKPICDSSGVISRAVFMASDITGRKNAELALNCILENLEQRVIERTEQLEKANVALAKEIAVREEFEVKLKHSMEEAKAANLAKSEFLANMSHEIRTPMNSVLGFIDLLLSTELTDKQTEYAEIVRSSGSLLLLLIDDILDLSKIEAKKLILETIPFSLGAIMREIIKLFEPRAIDKGITLSLELDPYFDENEVSGDCHRIRQVMVNLIGNAVKFTRHGYVKIKASCKQKGEQTCFVEVTVEDTGIGISSNDLPKIFEKFTQANTGTTRKFGGTGLGLAITRRLVDLMGGTLGCCSTPGKGSEFFFNIPLAIMADQPQMDIKKLLQKSSFSTLDIDPAKTRILIVEDDEASRKFVESCLDQFGFQHHSLENGLLATENLNRNPYDLVIMDWCLPGWSGLAVVEQLRQNPGPNKQVPVIAVTARAMKGDRETCLKAGMNAYLAKPFPPEDLLKQILKLLTFKDQS